MTIDQAIPVPLRAEPAGIYLVGSTAIPLAIVLASWKNGLSPEQIVAGYPTLQLADIYLVIAYYLLHRKEVEEYLHWSEPQIEEVRKRIEARPPSFPDWMRARVEAARARREPWE